MTSVSLQSRGFQQLLELQLRQRHRRIGHLHAGRGVPADTTGSCGRCSPPLACALGGQGRGPAAGGPGRDSGAGRAGVVGVGQRLCSAHQTAIPRTGGGGRRSSRGRRIAGQPHQRRYRVSLHSQAGIAGARQAIRGCRGQKVRRAPQAAFPRTAAVPVVGEQAAAGGCSHCRVGGARRRHRGHASTAAFGARGERADRDLRGRPPHRTQRGAGTAFGPYRERVIGGPPR